MDNLNWDAALGELSMRPEETKGAISHLLEEERSFADPIMLFSRLPSVAKVFGKDYEVEITKKILEHPSAKEHDRALLFDGMLPLSENGSLLDHLAVSGQDVTGILDKLSAEGRIELGSEVELKWRRILSGSAPGTASQRQDGQLRRGGSHDQAQKKGSMDSVSDRRDILLPTIVAGCILLMGLGLLAWRRKTNG